MSDYIYRSENINTGIGIKYQGGKSRLLPQLLKILPKSRAYIEPFCGSCRVLLNRPRSQYEYANDTNLNIMTLFKVLRERYDELIAALDLTPDSYVEGLECKEKLDSGIPMDDIERTRCFLTVNIYSTFNGDMTKHNRIVEDTKNGITKFHNSRQLIVYHMLPLIRERLKFVVLTQNDYKYTLKEVEGCLTRKDLIYCDPPYAGTYCGELGDAPDPEELMWLLNRTLANWAITFYTGLNKMYDDVFNTKGVWRVDFKATAPNIFHKKGTKHKDKKQKTESIYTNYEPKTQVGLFPFI